ncbi:MAG: response regulator transcription factor [Planctomycetes bacterium]|nr:response regulator transcription factor [Planctomycetota bacterium]
MASEPTVFVVDDDELARRSVCALVRSMRIRAESFSSAEEFLRHYRKGQPGCLVTDVRMTGMSGLELQRELQELDVPLPVIVMTAFARVPMTVEAMKRGAVTFLEKPCEENQLWEAIRDALARDAATRSAFERREESRRRLATLTPAERKVMELVVAGEANKVIAKRLGVSIRTVEARRHEVFAKTQVDSVAELVRLVMEADPNE